MNFNDFEALVIKHLKSDSLKKVIIKERKHFTPIELCKMVCEYVEKLDDRLFLLNKMLAVIDNEEMIHPILMTKDIYAVHLVRL